MPWNLFRLPGFVGANLVGFLCDIALCVAAMGVVLGVTADRNRGPAVSFAEDLSVEP